MNHNIYLNMNRVSINADLMKVLVIQSKNRIIINVGVSE